MANFKNLLSAAMLASMLAVAPSFAAGEDDAPAGEFGTKIFSPVRTALSYTDVSTYGFTQSVQNNHPHKIYILKWAAAAALIGTNPHLQGVAAYVSSWVQGLLGTVQEEIEADEEPTRLVIGRKA